MQSDLTLGWVIGAAARPLVAHQESLAAYPNVGVGEEDLQGSD